MSETQPALGKFDERHISRGFVSLVYYFCIDDHEDDDDDDDDVHMCNIDICILF